MRFMLLVGRRTVVATCAVGALCVLTSACGSNDVSQSPQDFGSASSKVATSTAGAGSKPAEKPDEPPVPTAAQLDAKIKGALDRGLPDDQRLALIEDGEAFRSSIPDLYKAMSENPNAKYMVVDPVFDNHDGTLTATFKLDKDGSGTAIRTATVHFVDVDGEWKIDRNDLCGILRTANYHTQACG